MAQHVYGVDLGTSNIKMYSLANDVTLNEKKVIAIKNKNEIFKFGDFAFEMYEKAPAHIEVSYPMSYGNIGSINNLEVFLKSLLEKSTKGALKGADYYLALPTDVQDRVFTTLIRDAGLKPRNIHMVDMPVAAGLGLGINVKEAQGVLVVDVGADTTEVSILSLGGKSILTSMVLISTNSLSSISSIGTFLYFSKTSEPHLHLPHPSKTTLYNDLSIASCSPQVCLPDT